MGECTSSKHFIHTFTYSRQHCEESKTVQILSWILWDLGQNHQTQKHCVFLWKFLWGKKKFFWKCGVFVNLVKQTGIRCIQKVNWPLTCALWSSCDEPVIESLTENLVLTNRSIYRRFFLELKFYNWTPMNIVQNHLWTYPVSLFQSEIDNLHTNKFETNSTLCCWRNVSDNELSVLMPQGTSLLNFVINHSTLYKDQIRDLHTGKRLSKPLCC